jgi:oligopeptide transport system substrate-binding protein
MVWYYIVTQISIPTKDCGKMIGKASVKIIGIAVLLLSLSACDEGSWNDPYPESQAKSNTLYLSFSEAPKRLDPATAYLVNETQIVNQIYEPPLEYHYLLRPYTLIPQTLIQMPTIYYLDKNGNKISDNAPAEQVAYTVYELRTRSDIYYQPHPAFAKDEEGNYLYHGLNKRQLAGKRNLKDFPEVGTRVLRAEDYIYQIKRLAAPNTASPILGLMRHYIVGLDEYAKQLSEVFHERTRLGEMRFIDLREYPLEGVEAVDATTYRIKIHGKYPQFQYWLAMHFFSPVPWEADAFYEQPGLAQRNISLNWYPIGTGPYQLAANDPNRQMELIKNPNYHGDIYPMDGEEADKEQGLLALAGEPLPFLDRIIYVLDKEMIPQWNKFLQGYYDYLRLGSDTFEQAIQIDENGFSLTQALQDENLELQMRTSASVYYWGFNMLDPVVGGYTEKAKKLRRAISLAVDVDEYVAIFANGLGVVAHGPIPPEIFGYEEQQAVLEKNPFYDLKKEQRLATARKLLAEAGYPNGRNSKTGEPLVLGYDVASTGSPDDKSRFGWLRKQLAQINVEVEVRATQYSRFQQKMSNGDIQIFYWTWIGDYPDPENFLFLFYGPSSVAENSGNNRSNYKSVAFDELFETMHNMENSPERAAVIKKMIALLDKDLPWFGQFYPQTFVLSHDWVAPTKPTDMIRNTLKYQKIDPIKREEDRERWNQPVLWPLFLFLVLLVAIIVPVVWGYYRQQNKRMKE